MWCTHKRKRKEKMVHPRNIAICCEGRCVCAKREVLEEIEKISTTTGVRAACDVCLRTPPAARAREGAWGGWRAKAGGSRASVSTGKARAR